MSDLKHYRPRGWAYNGCGCDWCSRDTPGRVRFEKRVIRRNRRRAAKRITQASEAGL